MKKLIGSLFVFAAVSLAALTAGAAAVSEEDARLVAEKWKGGGARVQTMTACTAGAAKYWAASYYGGGFALVAGDDRVDPVIFYSPRGVYEEADGNAMLRMIKRDFEERWNAAGVESAAPGGFSTMAVRADNDYARANRSRWAKLQSKPVSFGVMKVSGDDDLEDIRVPKLVQSQWDQEGAGGYAGKTYKCYNYYTPYNIYCGCVATAFAQVLRYHEWPKTSVTPVSNDCIVGRFTENGWTETTNTLTMAGGVYDWSRMPLETSAGTPDFPPTPEAQRQEIGKLCSDLGIAFKMSYTTMGSAANAGAAIVQLKEVFHYAQSECIFWNLSNNLTEYSLAQFQQMVVPSLEAGLPCVLTIYGDIGGHEVVCDGYGYQNGEFYIHYTFPNA